MGLFSSKVAHRAKNGTLVTDHNFERNMLGGIGLYLQFRFANHSRYHISKDYFLIEESWQCGEPIGPVSNPHFAAVNISKFQFQPTPGIETFSFLVKKSNSDHELAVLHASLYRKWVNYSFLIQHIQKGQAGSKDYKQLSHACNMEGIGLITFHDADIIESYTLVSDATRHCPNPRETDEFIDVQFSEDSKTTLKEWIRQRP